MPGGGLLPGRRLSPVSSGDVRLSPRPLLARMLGTLPCGQILPVRDIIILINFIGQRFLSSSRRSSYSSRRGSRMPRRPVRRRRLGSCSVRRSMPSRIFLPRGFHQRARATVRVGVLLPDGIRISNQRDVGVVCCWRGRGVDPERSVRVLIGSNDGRRWVPHASVGNVDRREVSRQHRRVERDGAHVVEGV